MKAYFKMMKRKTLKVALFFVCYAMIAMEEFMEEFEGYRAKLVEKLEKEGVILDKGGSC